MDGVQTFVQCVAWHIGGSVEGGGQSGQEQLSDLGTGKQPGARGNSGQHAHLRLIIVLVRL